MSVYVPVRLAQRTQLERVHLQGSLLDDPPVLIRATSLPVASINGAPAYSPSRVRDRQHSLLSLSPRLIPRVRR